MHKTSLVYSDSLGAKDCAWNLLDVGVIVRRVEICSWNACDIACDVACELTAMLRITKNFKPLEDLMLRRKPLRYVAYMD